METEENKPKLRWFKFFFIYKEAFEELSGRQCKKLIIAICDYIQFGIEPKKLDKHTRDCFDNIKSFYCADKELYKIYGSKGGRPATQNRRLREGYEKQNRRLRVGYSRKKMEGGR